MVYQPQPVYVAPQPVYAAPQPVYVAPESGCTRHYVQGHWAWGG